MQIRNILDKIDEDQIFVPAFQREYVWKRDDAKLLIDSLIKQYPTGTMLTWETNSPPELKGPHKYTSQQGAVKLLLDGQQRITTLYMLIRGAIPPYYTPEEITNSIMGLFVNLDSLELSYYMKSKMDGNPYWQNITDIFQRKVTHMDIIRALQDQGVEVGRDLEDRIYRNARAIDQILDREFPEQVIPPKASIKEAIDIFYKVNASGVALTEAELALAQISGYWPQARDLFKSKLTELAKNGFLFKLDFIIYALLGCMYYMASDMRRLHGVENLEPQYDEDGVQIRHGIKEAWARLEGDILDYVMNLLRTKAFVDHTKEINSVYALIPIIVFFYHKHGKTVPEQQLWRVIKWFYYSQVRSRYSGTLHSKLDFDLRIVKQKDRPFEELLGVIAEDRMLKILPEEFSGRTVSHPLFGLMRWYLKSRGATCFTTGLGIHQNMGQKYQLENDHIFPTAILKKNGYSWGNRIQYAYAQEITNRALLTSLANRRKSATSAYDYLSEVKEKSPGALEKQCIPTDEALWEIENYQEFLKARRTLLADGFNSFLEGLAEENLEHYGAASLEELIADGESSDLEFKTSLRWGSSDPEQYKKAQLIVMKTIAGFSNGDGGTLLIGISDDGVAVGLENDFASLNGGKDEFELHLGQLIDNAFSRVFRAHNVTVSFPVLNGLQICRIDIMHSDTPVVLEVMDKNGVKDERFYLRTGNSTQALSMSEMTSYLGR